MILAGAAAVGAEEPATAPETTALLIIDVQAFYFPEGMMPLAAPEAASAKAGELLACFREAGRPVVHVQHLPKGVDEADPTGVEPQYRIHPDVLPKPGEPVIGKHHANSFRDTELEATLRELGVKRLVVAGMQTHMCVEAAVRAAADLGFQVTVAHDACATRDLSFEGTTVPAGHVHAAALAAMASSYAEAAPVATICREVSK
jgi:nicotinamidase-related amidase